MFLPSRALFSFNKYVWENSISGLCFSLCSHVLFLFKLSQCLLLQWDNCAVFGTRSRAPLAHGFLHLPLQIRGAVSVQSHLPALQEVPDGGVTERFLMDMDCNKPNIPTYEIMSVFRAEQPLISQSSATVPPISARF